MLDGVLAAFQIETHYDLGIMTEGQSLFQSSSRILTHLEPVLRTEKLDMVIVQGDTTTTLFGALAAFYVHIPVAHVEAGLRTRDLAHPFPEEMNRLLTGRLAAIHFAATPQARRNLLEEGIDDKNIHVTGNTGVDALLYVRNGLNAGQLDRDSQWLPESGRKLIVVTAHRRESFGEGFVRICDALRRIADRSDVRIVLPVHPNPNVRKPVNRFLAGHPHIRLIEPLEYVPFVDLMDQAYLLLTDSGGIQEEAPSLGKPVLVMRVTTERPEAVEAGTAKLVGTDVRTIVDEVSLLLDSPEEYSRMARTHNPYGDGNASARIGNALEAYFSSRTG